ARFAETRALGNAHSSCAADAGTPGLCLFVRALSGEDATDSATYASAQERASPTAQTLAETLAEGGPRDPAALLENAASAGDPEALGKREAAADREVDDGVRAAWVRAFARGTHWVPTETLDEAAPAANAPEDTRWTWVAHDDPAARCDASAAWTELGPTET